MAARKGYNAIASLSKEEAKAIFPQALHILRSHYLSICLSVTIRLDVPTIIGRSKQPLSTEDIVKETGRKVINANYLKRIMRYLSSEGIFHEHPGPKFTLTKISQLYRTDVPLSLKSAAMCSTFSTLPPMWNSLGLLEECVLSDHRKVPFTEANNKPFFDYLASRPQDLSNFNAWMTTSVEQDSVKNVCDDCCYEWNSLKPGTRIMDVGGGQGSLMKTLKDRYPELHCIVLDLPQVIDEHPDKPSNVEFIIGDFFDSNSMPKADMIIMKRILHDWDDDDCIRILKSCVNALPKGGKILIIDDVIPEPGELVDKRKIIYDIQMMIIGGKERTLTEWKDIFSKSGIKFLRFIPECLIIETEKL